jgi:hypothetical protein
MASYCKKELYQPMHNITLISTFHSELVNCNSNALYQIIESINPEVIFEELPKTLFDKLYGENSPLPSLYEPLEIKCIKQYLQNYNISHVPVDIEPDSNLSESEINYMFNSFKQYHLYNQWENEQFILTEQYGFTYLNSKRCSELLDKKKTAEKNLLNFWKNDHQLLNIHKAFIKEQDNRENGMLQNIYNYSLENQYHQAVFLIGSGHRNSIMEKVTEYDKNKHFKLNWKFFQCNGATY